MNIFYITSISADGMHFIPLSMEGVIARIVFELPGTKADLITAIDTGKEFNAKRDCVNADGKAEISSTYNMKVRLITDMKGNLLLGTGNIGYHTEISINDFRQIKE